MKNHSFLNDFGSFALNNVTSSRADYSPFGTVLYGRSWSSESYRYGFNGKERDIEGMGGGSQTYDYGFRIYNPALARFLSADPLFYGFPWNSAYAFAENRVIDGIDLDGLEYVHYTIIKVDGVAVQLNVTKTWNPAGALVNVFQAYHCTVDLNGQLSLFNLDKKNPNRNATPAANSIMANINGSGSITTLQRIQFMPIAPIAANALVADQAALLNVTTGPNTNQDVIEHFGAYNQFNNTFPDFNPAAAGAANVFSTRIALMIGQGYLAGNALVQTVPNNVTRVLICTDGTQANIDNAKIEIEVLKRQFPEMAFALVNDNAAMLAAVRANPALTMNDVLVSFNPTGNSIFAGGSFTFDNIPSANIDMPWQRGNGTTPGDLLPIAPVMNATGVTNTSGNPVETN